MKAQQASLLPRTPAPTRASRLARCAYTLAKGRRQRRRQNAVCIKLSWQGRPAPREKAQGGTATGAQLSGPARCGNSSSPTRAVPAGQAGDGIKRMREVRAIARQSRSQGDAATGGKGRDECLAFRSMGLQTLHSAAGRTSRRGWRRTGNVRGGLRRARPGRQSRHAQRWP